MSKTIGAIALIHAKDTLTCPDLAKAYVEACPPGIDAFFQTIPGEGNGEALEATAVSDAFGRLLWRWHFPFAALFLSGEE
jgi:NADPH-dependent curcumin reductase CurA